MEEKDISDLVRKYKDMLVSGKSIYLDAEEFDSLAEYYDLVDDTDEAKNIVNAGLRIHPENHYLMLKKAKFMVYDGYYTKAIEYMNAAIREYDLEYYLLRIECLLKLDLNEEADEIVQEILDDENNEVGFMLSELGFIYIESELFEEGIIYLERSLEHMPDNMEILVELAYAHEMLNDFASSIKINNKILDIDPYSYEAWINIGKLYSLMEEYEKAIDAFDFAQTIDDESIDILKLKAHCLSLAGREDEAFELFKDCIVKNPDDPSLYYSLSDCLFSLEKYDQMLDFLEKYEEENGENIVTISKKIAAFLQTGENEKALEYIQRGLELDKDNEDLMMVAGEYYYQHENFEMAEKFFLKIYETNKKNAPLLDRLSIISIFKGDIDKSIEYLELLDVDKIDSQTKIRLALLYFENGDKLRFNTFLDSFSDDELKSILTLFFAEDQFDLDSIDRETLINRLDNARECRLLFKNLKY